MANWYCNIDGKIEGPITSAQLKAKAAFGEITPTTPVRRDGAEKWVEAQRVSGLEFVDTLMVPVAPTPEAVVEASFAETVPPESNAAPASRLCPFCSETIMATAIKCKHCGEFFDQSRQPTRSAVGMGVTSSPSFLCEAWPNLQLIAAKQKFLIWTVLAGVILEIPIFAATTIEPVIGVPLALLYLVFRIVVAMQLGLVAFQEKVLGVFLALLTIMPCIGLILLLVINGKATSVLKSHGIKVGLMGADPRSIP